MEIRHFDFLQKKIPISNKSTKIDWQGDLEYLKNLLNLNLKPCFLLCTSHTLKLCLFFFLFHQNVFFFEKIMVTFWETKHTH